MPRLKDVIADWVDHNDGPFIRPTAEELAAEAAREAVANTSYDPATGEYSMRRIPAPMPSWYGRGMEDFVDRQRSITDAVRESAADFARRMNSYNSPPLGTLDTEIAGAVLSPEDIDRTRAALLSRPPESMWAYPTMYGEMGRLDPQYRTGMCTRCGEVRECETRRRSTLTPAVEYPDGGDPDPNVLVCGECLGRMLRPGGHSPELSNRTATGVALMQQARLSEHSIMSRILCDNEYLPPLDQPVPTYVDGQPANQPDRPAHYAVSANRCSCGYRALRRHVDIHIRGNTAQSRLDIERTMELHRVADERLRAELNAQSAAQSSPVQSADLHYRVGEGGKCACGFVSMFTGEMDQHIALGNAADVPDDTVRVTQHGRQIGVITHTEVDQDGLPGDSPCARCGKFDAEVLLADGDGCAQQLCETCFAEECGPTPPDADPSQNS